MAAESIGIEGALSALHGVAGPMSLNRWMELNRASLLDAWNGRRLNWKVLCAWFEEVGLTNARGKPASVGCAKLMWHRIGKTLRDCETLNEAQRQADIAQHEERQAKKAQDEADAEMRRAAHERANHELAERQREEARNRSRSVLLPDFELHQVAGTSVTSGPNTDEPQTPELQPDRPVVRIGEVAKHVVMRKQAPRYGKDALEPLPEPYTGPRPAGMPEDLPLEALMPLTASGRTPEGKYDFERMPGLPRRSFFELDREWALCCLPMIEAIPPRERNGPLRAMFCLLEMKVGR